MTTFAEIREHVKSRHELVHDEPFVIGLDIPLPGSDRRQSVFLAELKESDSHRFLRVETTIAPLADHDPEKCLRVNLMLRTGYLAVGDLEGVAFLKLCENIDYTSITPEVIDYVINRITSQGDGMEQTLTKGGDWF